MILKKIYVIVFVLFLVLSNTHWEIVTNNGPEPRYINQLAQSREGTMLQARFSHALEFNSSSDEFILLGGVPVLMDIFYRRPGNLILTIKLLEE